MPSARLRDIQEQLLRSHGIRVSLPWLGRLRKRYGQAAPLAGLGRDDGNPGLAHTGSACPPRRLLSSQAARIFEAMNGESWRTAGQISRLSGTGRSTVRVYLLRWRRAGIVEMACTFPPCYRRRPADTGGAAERLAQLCRVRLTLGEGT
jgi:hypothetical protein